MGGLDLGGHAGSFFRSIEHITELPEGLEHITDLHFHKKGHICLESHEVYIDYQAPNTRDITMRLNGNFQGPVNPENTVHLAVATK